MKILHGFKFHIMVLPKIGIISVGSLFQKDYMKGTLFRVIRETCVKQLKILWNTTKQFSG